MGKRGRSITRLGTLLAVLVAVSATVFPATPGSAQTAAITEFSLPTANGFPQGIAAGPDGALWFTEQLGNRIGRITTAGVITDAPERQQPALRHRGGD